MDSIPWVRCASGNVYSNFSKEKLHIIKKKIEKWEIRKDKQSPRLKEKCSLSFSLWNTRLREGNPCSLVKSLNRLLVRDTDHQKWRFTMKCSAAFYYLTKVWSLHSAAHWDKEKGLWGNCPSPEIQYIWFGASINLLLLLAFISVLIFCLLILVVIIMLYNYT